MSPPGLRGEGGEDVVFVDLRDVRELWREGLPFMTGVLTPTPFLMPARSGRNRGI